jgi:hypothetical protein
LCFLGGLDYCFGTGEMVPRVATDESGQAASYATG